MPNSSTELLFLSLTGRFLINARVHHSTAKHLASIQTEPEVCQEDAKRQTLHVLIYMMHDTAHAQRPQSAKMLAPEQYLR